VPIAAVGLIAAGMVSLALAPDRRRSSRTRTAWAHAAFWAVVGIVMAISPTASWDGRPVRLPNTVIGDWLPIYRFLRIPNRLGAVGLVGLALLAGLAFAECARRLRDRAPSAPLARIAAVALAALFIAGAYAEYSSAEPSFEREALPRSYPLAPAISPDSPVVRALQAPGGALVELPVGLTPLGCLPGLHAQAEYRSIFHWRPLLNGYNGYWPTGFIERMELANRLPDAEALGALRRETGVEMILVHLAGLLPIQVPVWAALAEHGAGGLRLVARDGSDLLFQVEEAAPAPGQ